MTKVTLADIDPKIAGVRQNCSVVGNTNQQCARLPITADRVFFLAFVAYAQQPTTETPQQRHDRLLAAVQGICPVSGEKLGGHAVPMKATYGESEESLFACCEICTTMQPNPGHFKMIHARFAAAQGKCIVMGKKLPTVATSTIVKGQRYFLCGPHCAEKLAANPASYQKKLHDAYAAYL